MEGKSLQVIAIALIVIGLVIGIGFLVLEEFEGTLGTTTTTVFNESLTATDAGVFVAFNHTTRGTYCYNSFTVGEVTNSTDGRVVQSGNYSSEPATGRFWNISNYAQNEWNVTYTYNHNNGEACKGINDTITAQAVIPTWLTIIVLVLIVGIILYMVFTRLPESSNGSQGVIAQV